MQFERFFDEVLAHASYLVGDEGSGLAAVVDPRRDVDVYVEAARARGLKLKYAILTQTATSFVSGHIELRDREGCEILVGRDAPVEFAARHMSDGDELALGPDVRLTFIETTGRSEDSLAIVLQDRARGPSPWGVLTGDVLPLEGPPRPDPVLVPSSDLAQHAATLYATVREKLLLPDSTRVYPSRGTGPGRVQPPSSVLTLGHLRAANPFLRLTEPAAVQAALASITAAPAPPYAPHVARRNREERPSLEVVLDDVVPLEVDAVLNAIGKGALLVDARAAVEHAAGHMRGALAIPIEGRFAPWVGTLVPPDRPLILLAPDGRAIEAAVQLMRIGYDSIWGHVRGGMASVRAARPDLVARSMLIGASDLVLRRDAVIVDVRTKDEAATRRLPGAITIPVASLAARAGELPRDRLIVLYCDGGRRATTGSSVLERMGLERVAVLDGGLRAWEDAGLPVDGKEVVRARPEPA